MTCKCFSRLFDWNNAKNKNKVKVKEYTGKKIKELYQLLKDNNAEEIEKKMLIIEHAKESLIHTDRLVIHRCEDVVKLEKEIKMSKRIAQQPETRRMKKEATRTKH